MKKRSLGWVLIQQDWCPYKKEKIGIEGRWCEDIGPRRLSASQGERLGTDPSNSLGETPTPAGTFIPDRQPPEPRDDTSRV